MSTITVDPRIRARRVAVARDAGRRRLHRLVVAGAVLGVAAAGLAMTWSPVVDVEDLSVVGEGRTSADAITEAAGVAVGDSLVWLDTGEAERAIEALPWIDEATVHRSWSGAVDIEVTERAPVAALATSDGRWAVLDGTGRVLQVVEAQPTDVPLIEGLTATARPGETLDAGGVDAATAAAAVPAELRADVGTINATGDDLAIALRDGGAIVMGGADDERAKLASAAAVLATVPAGCVQQLDVSVASSPALIRIPGCS